MSSFRIGDIEAEPGTKVSGFLASENLRMPDGSMGFWNIPVIIVNGSKPGPVFEVDASMERSKKEPTLYSN